MLLSLAADSKTPNELRLDFAFASSSRRLEVIGARNNGVHEGDTRGEEERVSVTHLPLTRLFIRPGRWTAARSKLQTVVRSGFSPFEA